MSRFLPLVVLLLLPIPSYADDWPQWLGSKRDGVWREDGLLDKFPAKGPTQLWKTEIGAGYAGPAVVGERVYVTDFQLIKQVPAKPGQPGKKEGKERVLCLDAKNGKILWKHEYDVTYEKIGYATGPRTTPLGYGYE